MSPLTWRCDGCGEWREDEWISVAHRKVPAPALKQTVQLNAKYCNDRMACLLKVADVLERWAVDLFNAQAPRASSAPPTVHVLYEGATLCGRLLGVPKDWPEGHRWVGIDERDDATCDICRERAEIKLRDR